VHEPCRLEESNGLADVIDVKVRDRGELGGVGRPAPPVAFEKDGFVDAALAIREVATN
jgi:hypothetical protein